MRKKYTQIVTQITLKLYFFSCIPPTYFVYFHYVGLGIVNPLEGLPPKDLFWNVNCCTCNGRNTFDLPNLARFILAWYNHFKASRGVCFAPCTIWCEQFWLGDSDPAAQTRTAIALFSFVTRLSDVFERNAKKVNPPWSVGLDLHQQIGSWLRQGVMRPWL